MFGVPYRNASLPGFWGEVNSKANFCEEDYIITSYVAELINTCTNLTYVFYASYGIRSNWGRNDALLRDLPYLGIFGVGLGSTIFHGSLKYYTQWCDDLSMILAVGLVLHRVYTADKTIRDTILWGAIMSVLMILFGVWHCLTDDIVGHNILFAVMIVAVAIRTKLIIKSRVADPLVSREVRKLTLWGAAIFVTGYIIWNIDIHICGMLTRFKRTIGMPWSFVFELHGYWHIFTGMGAYIFIALVEYLTSEEAGEPLGGRFAWPVPWIVNGKAGSQREQRTALLPTREGELEDLDEFEEGVVVEAVDSEVVGKTHDD